MPPEICCTFTSIPAEGAVRTETKAGSAMMAMITKPHVVRKRLYPYFPTPSNLIKLFAPGNWDDIILPTSRWPPSVTVCSISILLKLFECSDRVYEPVHLPLFSILRQCPSFWLALQNMHFSNVCLFIIMKSSFSLSNVKPISESCKLP